MATETKTVYLGEFLSGESSANVTNWNNAIGHGADNNTYANVQVGKSTGATGYAFWRFDTSLIPQNASVDSVSCVVKTSMMSTSAISAAEAQLYSGIEPKGSPLSIKSTLASSRTMTPGTWTRDELRDCRLRIYYLGSSSTTQTRNIYLFGADLTVTYTYQNEKFMLKLDGTWHDVARIFKKVSGIWVEQTDLANVIEDGVRYQNGGEIISPKKTVTITGSGDATYSYVKINGVTYTSPATIEVSDGDVIEATVGFTKISAINPEVCCVKVDGQVYVDKGGTHKHTVTSDCTVDLYFYNDYVIYGTITITTGGGSSANLISFTIAGTSYQAEEGMTWGEWVASSYNNDGWADVAGKVVNSKDEIVCLGSEYQYAEIKTTDTIISGYAYDITI